MFDELPSVAVAMEATVSHSRWTPGQPGVERGKARRYVRLLAKVAPTLSEWRKVELTFARANTPEFTRHCTWVIADGSERDAGEWFHLARARRLVGEFKRRLERQLGRKIEYFKASEFQEDGWLHYHVLIHVVGQRGRMIGKHLLQRLWGWGVVWERPVDGSAVSYAAKGCNVAYASKGVEKTPPDYLRPLTSLTKLTSTSRGFYQGETEQGVDEGEAEAMAIVADAVAAAHKLPRRKRRIPTIGELLDDPRMGLRTKFRVTDGSTGEMVTREVKGGDTFTIIHTLQSMGWNGRVKSFAVIEGFAMGDGCGERVLPSGAAAGAPPPHPSLVKPQHCGAMAFIHRMSMALADTESRLRGDG